MDEKGPLFVGFGTLEGFLGAVDRSQPVLAMAVVEPGPEMHGLSVDELVMMVSQPDGSQVNYCRLRAASLTRMGHEPFDPDWKDREAAWHSLRDCVVRLLESGEGLETRCAMVARPKNLVLLEGHSERISYDRDAKRYHLKEAARAL